MTLLYTNSYLITKRIKGNVVCDYLPTQSPSLRKKKKAHQVGVPFSLAEERLKGA